jgi:hypothetical protein
MSGNDTGHHPSPAPAVPPGFVPGKNGGLLRAPWRSGGPNPGGNSAANQYRRCQELCRDHSPESARAIIKMERETDDDRVRFTCAAWVYERAWGKPKEFDPKELADNVARLDFKSLPPEYLRVILEICKHGIVQQTAPETAPSGDDASDTLATIEASAGPVAASAARRVAPGTAEPLLFVRSHARRNGALP